MKILCKHCKDFYHPLSPVYFWDYEEDSKGYKTGRVRKAVSHLLCEECGYLEIVNDCFDGEWMTIQEKNRIDERNKRD